MTRIDANVPSWGLIPQSIIGRNIKKYNGKICVEHRTRNVRDMLSVLPVPRMYRSRPHPASQGFRPEAMKNSGRRIEAKISSNWKENSCSGSLYGGIGNVTGPR